MPEQTNNKNHDAEVEDREAEMNRTLFLRAFDEKTTEDELYELFLQAGPLEKVAIIQNKNMAFITFRHSVSVPYAKELFSDTKLHGRFLSLDFRTGSIHAGNQRQARQSNHHSASPYDRQQSRQSHSQGRDHYSGYIHQSQVQDRSFHNMHTQGPYTPNPSVPSQPRIQGYRSADNREYEPQFVSFNSPPVNFRGGVPINHPGHQIPFDERRQRLLTQQRYVTQADMQMRQNRYDNRRR